MKKPTHVFISTIETIKKQPLLLSYKILLILSWLRAVHFLKLLLIISLENCEHSMKILRILSIIVTSRLNLEFRARKVVNTLLGVKLFKFSESCYVIHLIHLRQTCFVQSNRVEQHYDDMTTVIMEIVFR